jgi:hypothetical protein
MWGAPLKILDGALHNSIRKGRPEHGEENRGKRKVGRNGNLKIIQVEDKRERRPNGKV